MRPRVLLITRLHTQNAGNEGLSTEFIRYALSRFPAADVRAIDRYPRFFEQFDLRGIGGGSVKEFDTLAHALTLRFRREDAPLPAKAELDLVKLDETGKELRGPLRTLKRKLALRRKLAAWGLIERSAPVTAVTACCTSDLVVWNPAGEICPTGDPHQVMRLLLLLRIAQLSGRKTVAINHSLEIGNDALGTLIAHVYKNLCFLSVRDARSAEVAIKLGVRKSIIHEAPDMVFLASQISVPETTSAIPRGAIGLAVNGLGAMQGVDEWARLAEGLNMTGRPVVLVSNAIHRDLAFARRLNRMIDKSTVIDYQPRYQQLRSIYRQCDAVISSRLHASILALCEGVPVVSIEPSVFKLSAIFRQLDYPLETERLQQAGWSARVLAKLGLCLSEERSFISSAGTNAISEQLRRIEVAYAPLFTLA
jgi:polysaccharide pyruvyl transferase WcaK-like protein